MAPAAWWSYVLLVGAAVGWSLNGVIIKSVVMGALTIAFYRSAVAAVFLLPWAWPRRRRPDRSSLEAAAAYAATVVLLVLATKGTSAANAIILHYTAPFYVFVIGIPLLGERPGQRDWIALILAMLGVGCIMAGAGSADWQGIGYGVGSGMAFAMVILILRRDHARDPVWVTFFNNAVVALLLLPWVWQDLILDRRDFVLMGIMGVFQLGVPYVMFSTAVRQVRAMEASLIALLEPLLNPVWVVLAVGEVPSRWTVLGGSVVLAALASRYVFGSRSRPAMSDRDHPPLPAPPGDPLVP